MILDDYPIGYPRYVLFRDDDGFYLATSHGQVATLEEVKQIAEELVRYATKFENDIVISNIESEMSLERSLYEKSSDKSMPERSLYLMECSGRYKIGVSKDVDRRINDLDNRPFKVTLVAKSKPIKNAFAVEEKIHDILDRFRIDGEWFDLPEDVARDVAVIIRDANDEAHVS